MQRILVLVVFAVLALGQGRLAAPAWANVSLIRDAEIENTIRVWATPIFDAAGLVPEDVEIHLVNDRRLNAFVAGGQHLFLNTGLLIRSEHAGQVIGVIAHETGHIAGGHLARLQDALRNATAQNILAMVLAAGAGVASGRGDVAIATLGAGSNYAQKMLLRYTRTQESSADQGAVNYLDRNGESSRGLLEFFKIVQDEEKKFVGNQNPYLRTHPLTTERVDFVRNHVASSEFSDAPLPPEYDVMHRRMRAKLIGFLEDPQRVREVYYPTPDTLEARYAWAIAAYREADLEQALPMVDTLIAELPEDPYFYELRGQMLFENRRAEEALPAYQEAVRLKPDSGLLRMALAQVQLELNRRDLAEDAVAHLNEAIRSEPHSGFAWRLLAIAHGRTGDRGNLALALAEQAMLQGKPKEALGQAERAQNFLAGGSPGWLRAEDIVHNAKNELKRN
jgi:predicted Zn-dependent protease